MMDHKNKIWFPAAVSLLAIALPLGADASISAFKFLGIDGVGDSCGLDDRIGKVQGSTEHVINFADCVDYTGCSLEVKWGLDRTPPSGTEYVVKISNPGGACVDNDFSTLSGTCQDDLLVDIKTISSPNYMTFTVPFDYLTGADCQAGTDKATKIYIIIKESGADPTSETIVFDVDLERPAAPEIQEPDEGDSNITVKWKAIDSSSDSSIKYTVYWSDSTFTDSTKSNVDSEGPLSGTSYQITGLTNDVEYFFAVTSQDENENESVLSEMSSAMPIDVRDFWEMYQGAGGVDDGGFCFLATAAWGSYMAPEVRTLRAFRDSFLMTSAPGRAFVKMYYEISPPLADAISASPVLRTAARIALTPLLMMARVVVAVPGPGGWLAVFCFLLVTAVFVGFAVRAGRRS